MNSKKDKDYYKHFVEDFKSMSWTGWMKSKLDCWFKVLKYWAQKAIISNAENGLECLYELKNSTHFLH